MRMDKYRPPPPGMLNTCWKWSTQTRIIEFVPSKQLERNNDCNTADYNNNGTGTWYLLHFCGPHGGESKGLPGGGHHSSS